VSVRTALLKLGCSVKVTWAVEGWKSERKGLGAPCAAAAGGARLLDDVRQVLAVSAAQVHRPAVRVRVRGALRRGTQRTRGKGTRDASALRSARRCRARRTFLPMYHATVP
jgi:hypothetical protein